MRILGKIRTVYRLSSRVSTTINRNGKYSTLCLKPISKNGICMRFLSTSSDGRTSGIDKSKTNKSEKKDDLDTLNKIIDYKNDKIALNSDTVSGTILPAALLNDTKNNHKILLIPIDLTHDHNADYSRALHQTLKTLSLIQENYNQIQQFADQTSHLNTASEQQFIAGNEEIPLIENSNENFQYPKLKPEAITKDDPELSMLAEDGKLINWDEEFGATEKKYTPDDVHLADNKQIENIIEEQNTSNDMTTTSEILSNNIVSNSINTELKEPHNDGLIDLTTNITGNNNAFVLNEPSILTAQENELIEKDATSSKLAADTDTPQNVDEEPLLQKDMAITLDLPEYLESQLNSLPITSMKLQFEMEMPNVRDLVSSYDENNPQISSDKLLEKSLEEPSINMSTDVVLVDNMSLKTVPVNFNALIKGTVQILPEKMKNPHLAEMGTPELNDYITSVAANVCSVALQKGFDPNIGTALYETNPIAKSRSTSVQKAIMSSAEIHFNKINSLSTDSNHVPGGKKGCKQNKGKNHCKVCEDKMPKHFFTPDRNLQTNSCLPSSVNASLNMKRDSTKRVKYFKVNSSYLNRSMSSKKCKPPQIQMTEPHPHTLERTVKPKKEKKPPVEYRPRDPKPKCGDLKKNKNGDEEVKRCCHPKLVITSKCTGSIHKRIHSSARREECEKSSKDKKDDCKTKEESKKKLGDPNKRDDCEKGRTHDVQNECDKPKPKPQKEEPKSKCDTKKEEPKCDDKKEEPKSMCQKKDESKSKCDTKKEEPKSMCQKKDESKSKCDTKKEEPKSKCDDSKKDDSKKMCAKPTPRPKVDTKCEAIKKKSAEVKSGKPTKSDRDVKCDALKKPEEKCEEEKKAASKDKPTTPKKGESKPQAAQPKKAESKTKAADVKKSASKTDQPKKAASKPAEVKKSESKTKAADPKKSESKTKAADPKKSASKTKAADPKKTESKTKLGDPNKRDDCEKGRTHDVQNECDKPKPKPQKEEPKSKCDTKNEEQKDDSKKMCSKPTPRPKVDTKCEAIKKKSAEVKSGKPTKSDRDKKCDALKKSGPDQKCFHTETKCTASKKNESNPEELKKSDADEPKSNPAKPTPSTSKRRCGEKPPNTCADTEIETQPKCTLIPKSPREIQCAKLKKTRPDPVDEAKKAKCAESEKNDLKTKTEPPKRTFSTTMLYFKKDSKDDPYGKLGPWKPKNCFEATMDDCDDLKCPSEGKKAPKTACNEEEDEKPPTCAEIYKDELIPPPPPNDCYDYFKEMETKCRGNPDNKNKAKNEKMVWNSFQIYNSYNNLFPITNHHNMFQRNASIFKLPQNSSRTTNQIKTTRYYSGYPNPTTSRRTVTNENVYIEVVNKRKIEYLYEPIRKVQPHEVLCKVESVALSGSDLYMYETGGSQVPPISIGHEASGVIVKVGKSVPHLCEGDRISIEAGIPCGNCTECKLHKTSLCSNMFYNGSLAKFVIHPGYLCHKIPDCIDTEEATLIGSLSHACHACVLAKIDILTKLLIIGDCPVALSSIMCSRAMGCAKICVVCVTKKYCEIARKLNADSVILWDNHMDFEELFQKIYCGLKGWPNTVINSVASTNTMNVATSVLQSHGKCIIAGCGDDCFAFNVHHTLLKEIRILTAFRCNNMFSMATHLMNKGQAPLSVFISHRYNFDEVDTAFNTALRPEDEAVKVIVNCSNC